MGKINVAEILKDCPKGMELYSPLCGTCFFDRLNMGTIICKKQNTQEITFTREGYYMIPVFNDCECMLFPSKDQRDWSKFQRPFKDGDIVAIGSDGGTQVFIFKEYIRHDYAKCYMMLDGDRKIDFGIDDYYVARLATEEEKQKLFDAIKADGYKWNAETKTLEKLIEPKFKVGDKITDKNKFIYRITEITDKGYKLHDLKNTFITFDEADLYFVKVVDIFDINSLIPFESRVLVRTTDNDIWRPAIYGFTDSDRYYVVGGNYWKQCIPYEVNKGLLGTTNNPKEYGSE